MERKQIQTFIPWVRSYYWIQDDGEVYSDYSKRYLTKFKKRGYWAVNLQQDKSDANARGTAYFIHRLMMMAFRPVSNMENLQVNHKDGNKLNDTFDNMEWVTLSDNIKHAWRTGLSHTRKGEDSNLSKLSIVQVRKVRELAKEGLSRKEIGEIVNCSPANVGSILLGNSWKDIE